MKSLNCLIQGGSVGPGSVVGGGGSIHPSDPGYNFDTQSQSSAGNTFMDR